MKPKFKAGDIAIIANPIEAFKYQIPETYHTTEFKIIACYGIDDFFGTTKSYKYLVQTNDKHKSQWFMFEHMMKLKKTPLKGIFNE